MSKLTYKTIGAVVCHVCGERVPVQENENGTLRYTCNWCGTPSYAKVGTPARDALIAKMGLEKKPDAKQEVKKEANQDPKREHKKLGFF